MNIARKPPRPIIFQVMLDGEYAEVSVLISDNGQGKTFAQHQLDQETLHYLHGLVNKAMEIAKADR